MTKILNQQTGEWEPLPQPQPPPPTVEPRTPAEEARIFRVIITVAWAVFMLTFVFMIMLTYVR